MTCISKLLTIFLYLSLATNSTARSKISTRKLGHHRIHHSGKTAKDDLSTFSAQVSEVTGKSGKSYSSVESVSVENISAVEDTDAGSKSDKPVEVEYVSVEVEETATDSKSGKSYSSVESVALVEEATAESKASKLIAVSSSFEGNLAKSGKGTVAVSLESDISMSMMATDDDASLSDMSMKTEVMYTAKGKSGKSEAEYSLWTEDSMRDGKSGKTALPTEVVSDSTGSSWGGKAEKPLTDFFIKTSSTEDDSAADLAGKAGKALEIETIHIETTTITYENASEVEMIKAKSGKSEGYEYTESGSSDSQLAGKASKPSSSSLSSPSSSAAGKSSKSPSSSESESGSTDSSAISGSSSSPTAATSAVGMTPEDTGFDSGEEPDNTMLLTLAPTPAMGLKPSLQSPSTSSTKEERDSMSGAPTTATPTYLPTALIDGPDGPYVELSNGGETSVAINPFALNLHTNSVSPNMDPETIRVVTMEHLVHSFRNYASSGYVVNRLNLMLLDPEGQRRLLQEYELIFGGILYIQASSPTPTMSEIDSVVKDSFTGSRLEYYVNLLQEAGMDIDSVTFDEEVVKAHKSATGAKWRSVSVSLAGAVGGLALLATGVHVYHKKRQAMLMNDTSDIENGAFVIKLKDDAEVEEFPGLATVANTLDTLDDRSLPSYDRDDGDYPSLNSRSLDQIEQETFDPRISPLEEPPTRYISVFTVKKDVQGKSLDEIDLRSLVISYLSKMLKKFPNTYLLPYDKESQLSPITSIRNIPDELMELEHYVGNARVDEGSGKVLFNLRVESDMPVSKMKAGHRAKMPPPPPPEAAGTEEVCPPSPSESDHSTTATKEAQEAAGFEDVSI